MTSSLLCGRVTVSSSGPAAVLPHWSQPVTAITGRSAVSSSSAPCHGLPLCSKSSNDVTREEKAKGSAQLPTGWGCPSPLSCLPPFALPVTRRGAGGAHTHHAGEMVNQELRRTLDYPVDPGVGTKLPKYRLKLDLQKSHLLIRLSRGKTLHSRVSLLRPHERFGPGQSLW